jgi:hypothetical protein
VERTAATRSSEEPRRRPRVLRASLTVLLAVLALGAAGAATVGFVTLALRDDLEDGRRALEDGRRSLLDGRLGAASASFREAREAFRTADAQAAATPADVGRSLPVLGRTLDVAAALADAGAHTASAGLVMSAALERLPGGVDALAPTGGALPLDAFRTLAGPLEEAASQAGLAGDAIRSSPDDLLPEPVADARRQALARAEEVERSLDAGGAFARELPGFAGASGPRRYLFFAENPAELRGTGGLWGAYAILRVDDGRFGFSRFRPVQTLRVLDPDEAPAPNPEYRRNYERWGAPGYWVNMNMTPDFPSAARAVLGTWDAIGGEPLDGVLTADPFALRHLLGVTGRVRIAAPAIEVHRDNVVPLLANRAFARFPDPRIRKAVLGEVAGVVFDRFLELEGRTVPRLRAIGRSIAEGHLKIYVRDASMQEALVGAGFDGGLRANGGDLLAVIVNSASGGKVDFFSRRSVRHEVTLLPGAASTALTVTTIENGAPTSGQPRYVIGPHIGDAGDNIPLVSVFCGSRCRLVRAERDGERTSLFAGTELGHPYYQDYFTIPSEARSALSVRTETPGSWEGDAFTGSYRLTVLGQTTIRPTRGTVRIQAPLGMRFTAWSEGLRVKGDVATWTGALRPRMELMVSFEAPSLPVRLWRALTELF